MQRRLTDAEAEARRAMGEFQRQLRERDAAAEAAAAEAAACAAERTRQAAALAAAAEALRGKAGSILTSFYDWCSLLKPCIAYARSGLQARAI